MGIYTAWLLTQRAQAYIVVSFNFSSMIWKYRQLFITSASPTRGHEPGLSTGFGSDLELEVGVQVRAMVKVSQRRGSLAKFVQLGGLHVHFCIINYIWQCDHVNVINCRSNRLTDDFI